MNPGLALVMTSVPATVAVLASLAPQRAPSAAEIDARLADLHLRAGSPPDLRRRDQALAWLLQNAAATFPAALARLAAQPQDLVLLDLVGRYRRAEATSALERGFTQASTRLVAASGLGLSPDPAARTVLRRALASAEPGAVVAALSGLGAGSDTTACPEIIHLLHAHDPEVRWMAVEIGARLACLDDPLLAALSCDDADAAVRTLAASKLASKDGRQP